jgi:MFS family permease
LSSLYTFSGFITGLIYGWLYKKWGRFILSISIFITALGMFLIYRADTMVPVFIAALIEGSALSLMTPRFNEMIVSVAPTGAVIAALSIAQAANNLGQFGSPVVFNALGLWLDMPSYRLKFMLAAVVLGLMTVLSLVLNVIRCRLRSSRL